MQRTALFLITALAALSLFGCKKDAGTQDAGTQDADTQPAKNPFIGKWTLNYDLTMEESKKSLKYRPEVAQLVGMVIKNMAEQMKLEITAEEMIYSKDDKKRAIPYTITSTDTAGKSLTAASQAGDKEVQIIFTLIDDKYMNFTSTGSDDMNYYIWQPAE